MTRKVILSVAVVLVMGSLAQAWQKVSKAESISATATIQAIDKANRLVTLKDEKGDEDMRPRLYSALEGKRVNRHPPILRPAFGRAVVGNRVRRSVALGFEAIGGNTHPCEFS